MIPIHFGKKIDKTGVASDKFKAIPIYIINDDGELVSEINRVPDK